MISIHSPSRYTFDKQRIKTFAQDILEKQNIGAYTVTIACVGKRKMRDIASTYKNEDVALPVLAFPYKNESLIGSEEPLFGEIVLCYPQVVLLAAERGKTVDRMIEQLVEHGLENLFK